MASIHISAIRIYHEGSCDERLQVLKSIGGELFIKDGNGNTYRAPSTTPTSSIADRTLCFWPSLWLQIEPPARVEILVRSSGSVSNAEKYTTVGFVDIPRDAVETTSKLRLHISSLDSARPEWALAVNVVFSNTYPPIACAAVNILETGSGLSRQESTTIPLTASGIQPCTAGTIDILEESASILYSHFKQGGDLATLRRTIIIQEICIALVSSDLIDLQWRMLNLGRLFTTSFKHTRTLSDIDHAILVLNRASTLVQDGENHLLSIAALGEAHSDRFKHAHNGADCDQAIAHLQAAVSAIPPQHPSLPAYLQDLANAYFMRYEYFANPRDLDSAIVCHEQCVAVTPDDHINKRTHLGNYAVALLRRFNALYDSADVDKAMAVAEKAVELTEERYPHSLSTLAMVLTSRYQRFGNLDDLDRAIALYRRSITLADPLHPDTCGYLNNLGKALKDRFDRTGDVDDITGAVSTFQEALEPPRKNDAYKPALLLNLARALRSRDRRLGTAEDREESVRLNSQAAALVPDAHVDKHQYLANLSFSLIHRFTDTKDYDDLDRGIELMQRALLDCGDVERPTNLFDMGSAYMFRFQQRGALADADEAISLQEQALSILANTTDPRRPSYLNRAGEAYSARYSTMHIPSDIDRAIFLQGLGLFLGLQNQQADVPSYMINLSNSLRVRYATSAKSERNVMDISQAIHLGERALSLTPDDHGYKPIFLAKVGSLYYARYQYGEDLSDLSLSVTRLEHCLELIHDDHENITDILHHLSCHLEVRFERLRNEADLLRSLYLQEIAVAMIPSGHQHTGSHMRSLGNTLMTCFHHFNDVSYIDRAVDAFRGAAHSYTSPPVDQIRGAASWARSLLIRTAHIVQQQESPDSISLSEEQDALQNDIFLARDALQLVMDLIPKFAWIGIPIAQRYHAIAGLGSLVNETAATATTFGDLHRAVEWLEQGRSIVWGQVLQLRTPLDDLAKVHPQLSARLKEIAMALDRAGTLRQPLEISSGITFKRELEREAQGHRRMAEEYDKLLEDVRRMPGFTDFLRPKKFSNLMDCSLLYSRTIVILNSSPSTSVADVPHAIIIRRKASSTALAEEEKEPSDDVELEAVELSGFSYEKASKMLHGLLQCLKGNNVLERGAELRAGRVAGARNPTQGLFSHILSDLWKDVVEPVLSALGYLDSKPTLHDELPHVTWCATGPLAFLPLHAAGLYDRPGQAKVYHYVVSSYTPSLGAISHKKPLRRVKDGFRGILAASQPSTPGLRALPGTVKEVATIHEQALRLNAPMTWLNGEDASVASVLQSIDNHEWIHLACHGVQHADSMKSSFHLHDGKLDLANIMSKSFQHAEIAFLSACQTATGDETLPEEAVHLAAGLLMAGFRSVFATTWSIHDADAPIVAEEVYSRLLGELQGSTSQAIRPAYALHHAVNRLRDRVGEKEFLRWIPFVHLGL